MEKHFIELNENSSLFLMMTKNWQYNDEVSKQLNKYYENSDLNLFDGKSNNAKFDNNIEESILNKYPEIVNSYSFITALTFETITLKYINDYMIKILDEIFIHKPNELNEIYKRLISSISSHRYVESTGYGMNKELKLKYSPTQTMFFELHSILSLIQVKENNEELFCINMKYIINYDE
jgi:hypothetical protein